MKLNRNERITIINCLHDSINDYEEIIQDLAQKYQQEVDPDQQESITERMEEYADDINSKKGLIIKLGEAIGYTPGQEV